MIFIVSSIRRTCRVISPSLLCTSYFIKSFFEPVFSYTIFIFLRLLIFSLFFTQKGIFHLKYLRHFFLSHYSLSHWLQFPKSFFIRRSLLLIWLFLNMFFMLFLIFLIIQQIFPDSKLKYRILFMLFLLPILWKICIILEIRVLLFSKFQS